MSLVCTHCSRRNSGGARYCYFDGVALFGASTTGSLAQQTFPTPFVFPSGLACRDFDAFADGCFTHWPAAVDLLRQGAIGQFFNTIGRLDLGQAAQDAAAFPDRERGLDQFLARLPSKNVVAAKLDVQPKLINLGVLKVGQQFQLELTLENQGSRLIFGTVASSCHWLGTSENGAAKLFKFRDRMNLKIPIHGQHLRSANKPLEGDLFIESNAGTFRLKVIASVPIQAFAEGCLAGARTPREVAEKAKKYPREAGALFASGAVAAWYQANGWTYPVQGPASSGMAAVQQFFEALGLSRPPKISLDHAQIDLHGEPGTKLARQIVVRSDEHRPVFAHAISNASWCFVKPALVQGNAVTLPLEITVPNDAGQSAQAMVRVISNGQQQFNVPVRLTIDRAAAVAAAIVAAPAAIPSVDGVKPGAPMPKAKTRSTPDIDLTPAPVPQTAASSFDPVKLLLHLVPLLLLGFLLLGLVAKDYFSAAPKTSQVAVEDEPPKVLDDKALKEAKFEVAIKDEPDEGSVAPPTVRHMIQDEPEERFGQAPLPPVKVEFKDEPEEGTPKGGGKAVAVDPTLRIRYQYSSEKNWGLVDATTGKKLTYFPDGGSNHSVVRVGGQGIYTRDTLGLGLGRSGVLNMLPDEPAREARKRSSYSYFPRPGLRVTQILEIVPSKQPVDIGGGQQRRLMDTLLVRYVFENIGKQAINVGFRQEIDTLIGGNDGVPFTVPGKGLVNSSADFVKPELVPDFVQALETGRLRDPGTVVHVSLKVGGGIEAPSRVVLCRWQTNGDLSNVRPTNMGDDSAIVMIWPDQALPAGKKREVGYAYGLGSVTTADAGGSLAITLGGNYDIGQSFTITAYVNKPVAGQKLTLDLPEGLERIKGEQTQAVPTPNVGDTSIVSWEAKVLQTGVFPVKVKSSTGIAQTKTITIARGEAPTGGKLSLELQGDSYEPGKTFTVRAKINEPIDNQTVTLHLPAGLQKIAGADTQKVPAPPPGSKDASVEWQVKVLEVGKFPVRVSSSTGVAQTKTITIIQPGRAEGAFQILVSGEASDFAPGKAFTVTTKVVSPVPNQQLTLVLPAGLKRIDGDEVQTPRPDVPLSWKVKVEQAGKHTLGVKSTTGVTQRKTVVIEPPGQAVGHFDFRFEGDIRPGKEFKVLAQVTNPAPNQALKLVLPKGLQLTGGAASQAAPAPANPGGTAQIVWTVRVAETGRLPVRIESSTGLARTKTITLETSGSTLFGR